MAGKDSNMKKLVISLLFALSISFSSNALAQRRCATMDHLHQLEQRYPRLHRKMEMIEKSTQSQLRVKSPWTSSRQIIRIPVVVHVLYESKEQNISDRQILSQIQVLNQDYRRKNSDTIYTDPYFLPRASDSRIEFVLANRDPRGRVSTGITRTYTSKTAFSPGENDVKSSSTGGVDPWPTDQYLNIWVCNLGMGVLGYSQFPGGPVSTDGVVIDYEFFGAMGTVKAPFNKGRTATHEIGHYLNLRHIWGDGPCGFDDFVEDTPPAESPNSGCAQVRYTCSGRDMVQNFMDYTDDACMNLFTKGQVARMRALFSPGGFRESILNSSGYIHEELPEEVIAAPLAIPDSLHVLGIEDNGASLAWQKVWEADEYIVKLRSVQKPQWYSDTFESNRVRISRLPSCESYVFQVASKRRGEVSRYSKPFIFKTTGCPLEVPVQLHARAVGEKRALLEWRGVVGADSYLIEYKQQGVRKVYRHQQETSSMILNGLLPGARYLFRVKAIAYNKESQFSKARAFTTQYRSGAFECVEDEIVQLSQSVQGQELAVKLNMKDVEPVAISVLDEAGKPLYSQPAYRNTTDSTYHLRVPVGAKWVEIEDAAGFQHIKSIAPTSNN